MFGFVVSWRKPLSVHHSPAVLTSDSWCCCFFSCLCFLLGMWRSFASLIPMTWDKRPCATSSLHAREPFCDGQKMILPLSHAIDVFSKKSGKISRSKGREEMESVSASQEKKQQLPQSGCFGSNLHLNFNPKIAIKCRQLCLLSQKVSERVLVFLLWS